jgi:opacity protein-like surface antigen
MKQFLWFVIAGLFLCTPAQAQEAPAWEISGGYSSLTANLIHPRFHLNGGIISVERNLNGWFGLRFNFGAYTGLDNAEQLMQTKHNTGITNGGLQPGVFTTGSPTARTFTIGPVFSIHRFRRFTPFVHFGVGAIHASPAYLGLAESATTFAVSGGGGASLNVTSRVAFRMEGNYLTTTFSVPLATYSAGSTQGNIQLSAAVVIHVGKK